MKNYLMSYKVYINDTNIGVGTITISTKNFDLDDIIKQVQACDEKYKDKCVVVTFMIEI